MLWPTADGQATSLPPASQQVLLPQLEITLIVDFGKPWKAPDLRMQYVAYRLTLEVGHQGGSSSRHFRIARRRSRLWRSRQQFQQSQLYRNALFSGFQGAQFLKVYVPTASVWFIHIESR